MTINELRINDTTYNLQNDLFEHLTYMPILKHWCTYVRGSESWFVTDKAEKNLIR